MTRIVFMGTPAFSTPILAALIDQYDVVAVMTQPDRPVGRKHILTPSPVKQLALAHQIEVLQPEKVSKSPEMQRVIDLAPDFIVTAAFGQFLPTKLLRAATNAAINVHASLLPRYRGGAPVHYAIMNGDKETGVSIMYMIRQMDAGNVIAQAKVAIGDQDDVGTMFDKLSLVGRDLLLANLPKLIAGPITGTIQDETAVTFSPNISRAQEEIDFSHTASEIDWQVRGLRPFPTAYIRLNNVRTKLLDVTVLTDQKTTLAPGTVVARTKHALDLAAGHGTVLRINRLQPAGHPQMAITDFLNGTDEEFAVGERVVADKFKGVQHG
ncbi:methionyl-tRNA formyltransferase [Furfurilactobacillus curtus]|uniref:Methionyl-tRNA formyltransferase n=1 Tax=Furfurilactobacillus curtus TaxID=1746200 RepID=A0ABQ5JLS8_9LACO